MPDPTKILGAAHAADCRRFGVQFMLGCLYEAEYFGDGERAEAYCALLDEYNAAVRAETARMRLEQEEEG